MLHRTAFAAQRGQIRFSREELQEETYKEEDEEGRCHILLQMTPARTVPWVPPFSGGRAFAGLHCHTKLPPLLLLLLLLLPLLLLLNDTHAHDASAPPLPPPRPDCLLARGAGSGPTSFCREQAHPGVMMAGPA